LNKFKIQKSEFKMTIQNSKMNKLFKGAIFVAVMISGVFLFCANVFAQTEPLVVEFEKSPSLFNEANFLPGETITRWIKVTNNTSQIQRIGTKAINVNDPNHLGNVMYLEIKEGGTTRYLGKLSDFFNSDEIYLSDILSRATNTYYYSVTFDINAGDEYQGLGLGFDFKIGFLGESISPEIPQGVGGGGGGGGGASSGGLVISNEAIVSVGSNTVTITWNTNLNATTRVIYSPLSSNSVFDPSNWPNYGYDFSTTEDTNKVLHHSVTISGLMPSTTYVFRCVSHASPDTLSPEYSFTTLGFGEAPMESEQQLGEKTGQVLGEAIIRTSLPETGGLMGRIVRRIGLSSRGLFDYEINILFGGIFILLTVGVLVIRKVISK